jgi:iron only hydrogenase large subunit-like protein
VLCSGRCVGGGVQMVFSPTGVNIEMEARAAVLISSKLRERPGKETGLSYHWRLYHQSRIWTFFRTVKSQDIKYRRTRSLYF